MYDTCYKWMNLRNIVLSERSQTQMPPIALFHLYKMSRGWAWWLTPVIPAHWEAKAGGSPEVRSSRPAWATWCNPVSTKIQNISQAWWWTPVIPDAREAEVGELL